jgi:hypothetical protein
VTTVVAVLACALCASACLSVSWFRWHRDPDEEEPRDIVGAVISGIPGILFSATAIHLIIR